MIWDGKPPTSSWLYDRIKHHRLLAKRRAGTAMWCRKQIKLLRRLVSTPIRVTRISFLETSLFHLEILGAMNEEQVYREY